MGWANINHEVVHKATLEHKSIIDTYITNPTSGTRNQKTIAALEYAKLVCKELRGASYAMKDHKSVWIYREGDTHVMGWVGYGDWMTTKTSDYQFVMYAPFHENRKYREETITSIVWLCLTTETKLSRKPRLCSEVTRLARAHAH
jgi:hypothetical protein